MTKKSKCKNYNPSEIIGIILLITLVCSAIYSIIRIMSAPDIPSTDAPYVKVKSDYVLMLTQCILGLLVMFLPTMVNRHFKIVVPTTISTLYYIFLYCAIFLGEVFDFYYLIPHWDTMLHAFSGAMLGALGFVLVDLLNKDSSIKGVTLSPFFVSLFAFSFAVAIGAIWEIYEFSFDMLLGLNMQKHTTSDGIPLIGINALSDTMYDIIIDTTAALVIAIIGGLINKQKQVNLNK